MLSRSEVDRIAERLAHNPDTYIDPMVAQCLIETIQAQYDAVNAMIRTLYPDLVKMGVMK